MGNGAALGGSGGMPLFHRRGSEPHSPTKMDYKSRLEHKLYLARESPEPVFDLSCCNLKDVPGGIFSLCKVFRKESLWLQENNLMSLSRGGVLGDLVLLQVLDLHNNKFTKLPEEIGLLTQLKVLNVAKNHLKHLPSSVGNLRRLETLDVSNNSLKKLPESVGNLVSLLRLDMMGNKDLKALPVQLCQARMLDTIHLDHDQCIFPPSEVTCEGTQAIMRYLCSEAGVEYISPSDYQPEGEARTVQSQHSLSKLQAYDEELQAKLMELERRKEQKMQERLALEEQMERSQKREAEVQANRRQDQTRLLSDLAEEQSRLESEIQVIQQQRDEDRRQLISYLYEAESKADELISHLLALNEQQRDPKVLAATAEAEMKELEEMLAVRQESVQLRRLDVFSAMQGLLEEEIHKEKVRCQYEANRDRVVQLALIGEEIMDQQIQVVLESSGKDRQELINGLLEDESFQREAFAALFIRQDVRNQQLLHQMALVQEELGSLTRIETKKKDLQVDFELSCLEEKRRMLTELLTELMRQQEQRQKQLLAWLEEAERRRDQAAADYWLMQYQRLMDSQPASLLTNQSTMDPALRELLFCAGAERFVPFFTRREVTIEQLCIMGDEELKEVGVNKAEIRAAILRAVEDFVKAKEVVSHKLARLQSTELPSAPEAALPEAEERPASVFQLPEEAAVDEETGARVVENECVVCMDKKCGLIFMPCGHVCCCVACGEGMLSCPLCRQDITQQVQLFFIWD